MNKSANIVSKLKRTLASAAAPENIPTTLAAGGATLVAGVGATQGIKNLMDSLEAHKLDKNIQQQYQEADAIISDELVGKEAAGGKASVYQGLRDSLERVMAKHLPKGSGGAVIGATAAVPAVVGYGAVKSKMDDTDSSREKMDRIKAFGKRLEVQRYKTPQYLTVKDLLGDIPVQNKASASEAKKPAKVAKASKVDVKKDTKEPAKKKTSVDKDDPYGSMLKAADCGESSKCGPKCSCPNCKKKKYMRKQAEEAQLEAFQTGYLA